MAIAYFPYPYPDELLYSICARLYDRMQYPNRRDFIEELFGSRTALAVVDLPSHLKHLVSILPPNQHYTVDNIIEQHTTFPFYQPFLPRKRVKSLRDDLRGDRGSRVHMRAGLMASRIPIPPTLRFCQECVKNDRMAFGEAYWHRIHQLPGVRICPDHKMPLQNSGVSARNKSVRYAFISAERGLSMNETKPTHYTVRQQAILYQIATDATWLLGHEMLMPGMAFVTQRYTALLAKRGLATRRGNVRIRKVQDAIRDFYTADLLALLHCELDDSMAANWLTRLVRTSESAQHPLYHLLVMNFLQCSPDKFFNPPPEKPPFGKGPWPCLNPVCDDYQQLVIHECRIKYSRYTDGKPIGTFSCDCGFVYTRTGPDRSPEDSHTIGKVTSFGPVWEEQLSALWDDPETSLRQIGRMLQVDPKTVKLHAAELGLSFPRPHGKNSTPPKSHCESGVDTKQKPRTGQQTYRETWLSLKTDNPDAGVTDLRNQNPGVYMWLYRHDKQWLQTHKPPRKPPRPSSSRVDWQTRDAELASAVHAAGLNLRAASGRPTWITTTAIARALVKVSLIQQHLDKLPLTAQALDEVVESREEYAIRRIQWVSQCYQREGIYPKRWQLVRRAGVARLSNKREVHDAIDAALLGIDTYVNFNEQRET